MAPKYATVCERVGYGVRPDAPPQYGNLGFCPRKFLKYDIKLRDLGHESACTLLSPTPDPQLSGDTIDGRFNFSRISLFLVFNILSV